MRERTAHINRIKDLLFGQGIRGINVKLRYKTLKPADLVTGDGARGAGGVKTIMGSHLTNAAKLSNDWGPPQNVACWGISRRSAEVT